MAEKYSTGMIRRELAALLPSGAICHDTWQAIRVAAGVKGNRVTHAEWVRLCAAFALYRKGVALTPIAVRCFVNNNGSDPVAFLPGLTPLDLPNQIPAECFGRDLPALFEQWFGCVRTENTFRGWCEAAGLWYSRNEKYGRDEIYALIHQYAKAKYQRKLIAMENLNTQKSA